MPRFVIEMDSVADADHFEELIEELTTIQYGEDEPDVIATWTREDEPKQSLFLKIIPEES